MRVATLLLSLGGLGCGGAPPPCEADLQFEASGAAGNVVVVLLDDIGVEKLSSWGQGDNFAHTPVLDALDSQSVRFERAYATPSCSPSRATLLTGRRSRRTGIGKWIDPEVDDVDLADDEITIPEMLRDAPDPWTSAIIGKWHLSVFDKNAPEDPFSQGFDVFEGLLGNPLMTWETTEEKRSYDYWEYFADGERSVNENYLTTVTTDDAIDQLETLPEPFFLYTAYSAAHSPMHWPPAELVPDRPDDLTRFDAMIQSLDTELGRLFAAIDPTDTTVIVMGDNGTSDKSLVRPLDKHHAKNSIHEGGTHVPLWVWGAAVERPGETSKALVHISDIFSSVADIAGVSLESRGDEIDGRSFLPHLRRANADQRACLVSEIFRQNGRPHYKLERSIRDDRYVLIRHHKEPDELYNLNTPLGDLGDDLLADKPSSEVKKAHRQLSRWLKQDLRAVR